MTGIYQITCEANGRRYIGQTVDFMQRRKDHLYTLRKQTHNNDHLQKAYNKYGREAFKFEVVEEVYNPEDLDAIEQFWIDTAEWGNLFNIKRTASSPYAPGSQRKGQTDRYLIDPKGKTHRFVNIDQFARKHGLNSNGVKAVLRGDYRYHLGWTVADPEIRAKFDYSKPMINASEADLCDPDGNIVHVVNVTKFAKENGLQQAALDRVIHGKQRHHLCWTSADPLIRQKWDYSKMQLRRPQNDCQSSHQQNTL